MAMNGLFDATTDLLSKAVEYTEIRHRLLSNNIANLDTPNYKAVDLKFEDALKAAIEGKEEEPRLVLYTSNGELRTDGNTVEIEEQIVKMIENSVLHSGFVNLLKMKFRMLESAISGCLKAL